MVSRSAPVEQTAVLRIYFERLEHPLSKFFAQVLAGRGSSEAANMKVAPSHRGD